MERRAFQTAPGTVRDLAWLIALNALVRGLWLLCMHPPQYFDFQWYYTHAVDLAAGRGYRANGHYTAYWPIGYPFFLSLVFRLTGPNQFAGLACNALLSIGIVLLVYALGRLTLHRRRPAFAAALAYTLLPSQIEWNAVLGSEELFTCLAMASLTLYASAMRDDAGSRSLPRPGQSLLLAVCAGWLMGLACDVRPIPLLFPIVLLVCERMLGRRHPPIGRRRGFARAGLYTVALLAGVSLVTVRNWIALHHFIPVSTNGGVNLWQGTMSNGAFFWSWDPHVNPLLQAGTNEVLENQIGVHAALHTWLTHPGRMIWNGFAKWFFLYWVDWNVVSVTFAVRHGTPAWLVHAAMWGNTVVYWLWLAVCAVGVIRMIVRRRRHLWSALALPAAFILYNTAVFFFFPAWDRFRYPVMPLFALFFATGWAALTRRQAGSATTAAGPRSGRWTNW